MFILDLDFFHLGSGSRSQGSKFQKKHRNRIRNTAFIVIEFSVSDP
jgi:hypothetical protein